MSTLNARPSLVVTSSPGNKLCPSRADASSNLSWRFFASASLLASSLRAIDSRALIWEAILVCRWNCSLSSIRVPQMVQLRGNPSTLPPPYVHMSRYGFIAQVQIQPSREIIDSASHSSFRSRIRHAAQPQFRIRCISMVYAPARNTQPIDRHFSVNITTASSLDFSVTYFLVHRLHTPPLGVKYSIVNLRRS